MNRTVVAALFEDAFRQVLDDKVFRLLVGLALVMILPTFLVGFRPEGISVLFGWKTWTYQELGASFGGQAVGEFANVWWIGAIQKVIVNGLAGTVGLLFCIAATAFFVPRMLEKGAADTLFSKPVGRFALLVARFSAGVIFVACLSFLLVLGMHIGFRVASGYSDPAFLWSALTLTYIFTLVHSVSVTVAVLTRSSIAAILSTLLFFVFTGCIHQTWITTEYRQAADAERRAIGEEEAKPSSFQFLIDLLNTVHWTLPKTTDADYVVAGLRRTISEAAPTLRDSNDVISYGPLPVGFTREGPAQLDLGTTPALWIAREFGGEETARIKLSRRDRSDPDRPGRLRSPGSFAADFAREIEKDPSTAAKPQRSGEPDAKGFSISWVRWRISGNGPDVERARGFTAVDAALYEIEAAFQPTFGDADLRQDALREFVNGMRVEHKTAYSMDPNEWYTQQFGWTSRWRYNAFVSIGTSLLFALLMLLLARWRLARIDF